MSYLGSGLLLLAQALELLIFGANWRVSGFIGSGAEETVTQATLLCLLLCRWCSEVM